MNVKAETRVRNFEDKRKISSRIHLVHQLKEEGLEETIKYRSEEDVKFVQSIVGKNPDVVIRRLTRELYRLG
jgi:hypothetical protein